MSTTSAPATAATPPLDFAAQVTAFARAQGRAPYETPDLARTALRQREDLVRWHGGAGDPSAREWVYPGRTVIEVPGVTWQATTPEECPDDTGRGIWFAADGRPVPDVLAPGAPEGLVLLCPQCGLDCT